MKNAFKIVAHKLAALSPNCREATRLQSAALDRPLTLWEKAGLQIHLVLCKWCARYGSQIKWLGATARQQAGRDPLPPADGLSAEARERIKQELKTGLE